MSVNDERKRLDETHRNETVSISVGRLGLEKRFGRILMIGISDLGGEGPVTRSASPDEKTCRCLKVSEW